MRPFGMESYEKVKWGEIIVCKKRAHHDICPHAGVDETSLQIQWNCRISIYKEKTALRTAVEDDTHTPQHGFPSTMQTPNCQVRLPEDRISLCFIIYCFIVGQYPILPDSIQQFCKYERIPKDSLYVHRSHSSHLGSPISFS